MRIYLQILPLLTQQILILCSHGAENDELMDNKSNDNYRNPPLPSEAVNGTMDEKNTTEKEKSGHKNSVPAKGIGFIVEGIERSDFGQSLRNSNFQRSRTALGFQICEDDMLAAGMKSSLIKVFYESQRGPSNYEPEAIRVLCWNKEVGGMENFCACDENGDCFVPSDMPTYVEVQPYCDLAEKGVCHAYLELYGGRLKNEKVPTVSYCHPFDSGPFGIHSPYMKVSAISCEGCRRIRHAVNGEKCRAAEFTRHTLDQQKLDKNMLFLEKKFEDNSTGGKATAKNGQKPMEKLEKEIAIGESSMIKGSSGGAKARQIGFIQPLFTAFLSVCFFLCTF